MQKLQEIKFHISNGPLYDCFVCHLIEANSGFEVEVNISTNQTIFSLQCSRCGCHKFKDAEAAFEEICTWVNSVIGKGVFKNWTVTDIDNPCNTEFLSQQQQQTILQNAAYGNLNNVSVKVTDV